MKLCHIHPDDVRWLKRWLRSNLICVSIAACILLLMRVETIVPTLRPLQADTPSVGSQPAVAVIPHGWRRTRDGWEDSSTWVSRAQPLGEIIRSQQQREPALMQRILATVCAVPPLLYALAQVLAIAAIVRWTRRDRLAPPE